MQYKWNVQSKTFCYVLWRRNILWLNSDRYQIYLLHLKDPKINEQIMKMLNCCIRFMTIAGKLQKENMKWQWTNRRINVIWEIFGPCLGIFNLRLVLSCKLQNCNALNAAISIFVTCTLYKDISDNTHIFYFHMFVNDELQFS